MAVGLNGLSGAADYTSTVQGSSSLVSAGVGYGIWIVIVGSVMTAVSGLLYRFNEDARRQWIYSGVVVATVIAASIALYPKVSSNTVAPSNNTGNTGVSTNTGNTGTTTSLAPGSAGSAFSMNDGAGDNVDVEMVKILDPATPATAFDDAPSGDQLVAVQTWVQNHANSTFTDDMNSDVTLIGSDSQSYTAAFKNISACTNFNSGTVALAKE